MPQIAIDINTKQIEQIIEQMAPKEQKELERKLWAIRMDYLIAKLRKNSKKNKVSQKDIDRVCEEVRQELYEKRRNRY
ncbi:MAG: hypothetical protein AB1633_03260 [Elusimicrobiota bacterium]